MFTVNQLVVTQDFGLHAERNGEVMKVIGVLDEYTGKNRSGTLVRVFGYKCQAADGTVFVVPPTQLRAHIRADLVTVPWSSCDWMPAKFGRPYPKT